MTGASGIGPEAATALDAAVARKAKPSARGGKPPASGFEALLTELRPASAKEGEDRLRERAAVEAGSGSIGRTGRLGGWLVQDADTPPGEPRNRADGATEAATLPETGDATSPEAAVAGAAADVVTLDVTPGGAGLAQGVAGRIAAALDGDRTAPADAAPELQSEAGPRRPEGTERARPGAAISGPGADAGREPGGEAPARISITRRETHLGPAPSGAGDRLPDRAGGAAEGVSTDAGRGAASEAAGPARRRDAAPEPSVAAATRDAATEPARNTARRDAASGAAAARPGTSSEAAGAGAKRAAPPEAPGALPWRGTSTEVTPGAPTGAAPGVIGVPTGAAAPGAEGAGARFDAPPPVLHVAPAHVVAGPGPARVLHIRLQPAELGTLEVRMRMTDAGLEIHVEASRHETFALLQRDRDLLAGILRGAGHTLEGVTASLADKPAGQPQPAAQDGWQAPGSDGPADAQPGAPRERGGRDDNRFSSRPGDGRAIDEVQDDEDRPARAARSHGSLYL